MERKNKNEELSDIEKSTNVAINTSAIKSTNSKSFNSISEKYDRKIYEDKKLLKKYKVKTFGGKKTIKDEITDKPLYLYHKNAKRKFKSNASSYQAEVDHITSLERCYNVAKILPNLSNNDVKNIVNNKSNYMMTSKKFNASKKEKSNIQAKKAKKDMNILQNASISTKGIKSDMKVFGQLYARSYKGEVKNVAPSAIGKNYAQFLNHEKNLAEATVDSVKDIAVNSATSFVEKTASKALVTAEKKMITKIGKKASEKALAKVAAKSIEFIGGNIAQIVELGVFTANSLVDFVKGDISAKEMVNNLSFSAGNLIIIEVIQQGTAAVFATLGSVVPFFGTAIGGFIGETVGYLIGTIVAENIMGTLQDYLHMQERSDEYRRIQVIYEEFAEEVRKSRIALEEVMTKVHENFEHNLSIGYEMIHKGIETNNTDEISKGLDAICEQFNLCSQFKDKTDFDNKICDKSFVFKIGNSLDN